MVNLDAVRLSDVPHLSVTNLILGFKRDLKLWRKSTKQNVVDKTLCRELEGLRTSNSRH